jgi:hypothetical protein
MTRTRISTVLALAVFGAVLAFGAQLALAALGQPKFAPEFVMALSLLFIAGIVLALAIPIRRATRGTVTARIDPFHATRVVLLAKASSLAGALLSGAALGLVLELVVRSAGINTDSLLRALAVSGGAIALVVAGLVGEYLCTVPPEDQDPETPGAPGRVEP